LLYKIQVQNTCQILFTIDFLIAGFISFPVTPRINHFTGPELLQVRNSKM